MYDEGAPLDRPTRLSGMPKTGRAATVLGLIAAGVFSVGLISWGVFNLVHPKQQWPAHALASAAASSSYPIYYPSSLPHGFAHTVSQPKASNDVFIYTLTYDGNKKLFVSAVPKPAGVQFNDFYNRILSNKTNVLNPAGTAVVGTANDQPIGSLVTSKTWVTINAPKGIDTQRLQALVSSLKAF
jgi:hypothetical protein